MRHRNNRERGRNFPFSLHQAPFQGIVSPPASLAGRHQAGMQGREKIAPAGVPCGNPPGGDPARRRKSRGVPADNGTTGREESGAAEQKSTASNRNTNPPPGSIRERNASRFLPAVPCGLTCSTPFPRTGSTASPAGTVPLFPPGKIRLTATSLFQTYPCPRSRKIHGIRTPLRPLLSPRPQ